jgi:hypothetical protein
MDARDRVHFALQGLRLCLSGSLRLRKRDRAVKWKRRCFFYHKLLMPYLKRLPARMKRLRTNAVTLPLELVMVVERPNLQIYQRHQ